MKTYFLTEKNDDNTADYYISTEGDIFDTQEEAEITGCIAKVIVHGMYVGSAEEMRQAALEKYKAACKIVRYQCVSGYIDAEKVEYEIGEEIEEIGAIQYIEEVDINE